MPDAIVWSPSQDATILRMRAASASWDDIAVVFGLARQTVLERGRRIGARMVPPVVVQELDHRRGALPPGHTITWGAITAGTLLDGVAYPEKLFG